MAFERQIMRTIALKNIYGWISAVLSNFLPPILPIRFTWGNIINLLSTLKAWRIHLFGNPKTKSKWAKTEHSYLPKHILENYRRRIGDLLIERELINPHKLQSILISMNNQSKRLGEVLIENGVISENQLLFVLGELLGTGYIESIDKLINPILADTFSKEVALKFNIVPLLRWKDKILLASSKIIEDDMKNYINEKIGFEPIAILAPNTEIKKGLDILYSNKNNIEQLNTKRIGEILIENNLVDLDQLLQAFKVQKKTGQRIGEILVDLNAINSKQLDEVISSSYNAL
jgi:adsorption protein B